MGWTHITFKNPITNSPLTFEFQPPDVTTCDSNIEFSPDPWLLQTFKLFVGKCLKPIAADWLSRLACVTVHDLQNVGTCDDITTAFDDTIRIVLTQLKASPAATDNARKIVPSCLFCEHEVVQMGKQFMPFFMVNFQLFQVLYLDKHSVHEQLIFGDFKKRLQELRQTKWEVYGQSHEIQIRILNNLCFRLFSNLGIKNVIIFAFMRAYHTIIHTLIDHVYSTTGNLDAANISALESVLECWIVSMPFASNKPPFLPETVIFTNPLTNDMIITDYLIDKIYRLAVTDFPKSLSTLLVLRECMDRTNDYGRDRLVTKLIDDVSKKLLNVAEDTTIMLDGYASCVESLREIDPSCAIMHRVCSVIKEYLKRRPDTVKKIINYITSEKRDQLSKQLSAKKGTILDEELFAGTNDDFLPEAMDAKDWKEWKPDPPDAAPGQSGHVRQSADVFNMLISVYGSKELFVKEYRKLLAERLMSSSTKDPGFEKRYLDVLKLRFNDGELQQCEVMLKDVEDSIRFDRAASANLTIPINACIISSHFWPATDQDKVEKFPDELEQALKLYEERYAEIKASRRLNWLRARGFVDVTIDIGGVSVEKIVSNAHAAVLYLYTEKEEWTIADVSEALSITKSVARRRLEWWTTQGLLLQELPRGGTCEVWKLVTSASHLENTKQSDESEDEDQAALDDAADAIDALEVYWMYTKNFIAQNDNVKAERIHRMYRLFGSPSSQCPSLETVTAFLFRKVKANLLEFNNGHFRVVREPAGQ